MLGQHESQQSNPLNNPQYTAQPWGQAGPQSTHYFGQSPIGQPATGTGYQGIAGLGQAAFGQTYGQQTFGQTGFGPGQTGFGQAGAWGQRQLSPQDANEVVRQLIPLLPQVIAQAHQQHQQPMAAFGFGQRMLTQQDVNEVVRQILPIVPQIVAQLQGQQPMHAANAGYGLGMQAQMGTQTGQLGQAFQQPFGQQSPNWQQQQQPFGQQYGQQQHGQQGWPQALAAMGGIQTGQQRQLSQQDVSEVVRQLVGVIPNVISTLQQQQQRTM